MSNECQIASLDTCHDGDRSKKVTLYSDRSSPVFLATCQKIGHASSISIAHAHAKVLWIKVEATGKAVTNCKQSPQGASVFLGEHPKSWMKVISLDEYLATATNAVNKWGSMLNRDSRLELPTGHPIVDGYRKALNALGFSLESKPFQTLIDLVGGSHGDGPAEARMPRELSRQKIKTIAWTCSELPIIIKLLLFLLCQSKIKKPKPKCLLLHIHVLMTSHFLP